MEISKSGELKIRKLIREVLEESDYKEIIAYHSSDFEIGKFNFDDVKLKAGSSTRIDGIFFSNTPQKSWGDNVYKVKILSKTPVVYDLLKSRFDSLSVQEAFEALLRGETGYVKEDLENNNEDYDNYTEDGLWDLVDFWSKNLDLIVVKNVNYVSHKIEYIVPNPRFNGHSATIINLGKIN